MDWSRASYRQALDQMVADGLDMMVLRGWPMANHEISVAQNDAALSASKEYPDHFMYFCSANPRNKYDAVREVERCLCAGACGVGEIDPYGQEFSLDDVYFLKICDLCVEADVVLSLYTSPQVGNQIGFSDISLKQVVELLRLKPRLKVILSYMGGGMPFFEMMPEIHSILKNVFYDTAGVMQYCTRDAYRAIVDFAGKDKVLFASGYPLNTVGQHSPCIREAIETLQRAIPDPITYNAVLGDNAASLLSRGEKKGAMTWLNR